MKLRISFITLVAAAIFAGCAGNVDKTPVGNDTAKESGVIPADASWGVRMAETIMKADPELWMVEERTKPKWSYTHGLVGLSFLKLWQQTGNQVYFDYAKGYADKLIDESGIIKGYKMSDYNIDKVNSGKMLFVLYKETKDERYKTAIDTLRKQLEGHPRTSVGGFWHKKRYPHQMWLDGLYMGAPFYVQYGVEFGDTAAFDDVANWLLMMEQKSRDAETGLLYHAWDESREQQWSNKETGLSPHIWGRAMGWYAMALVDALDFIPADHAKRSELIEVSKRLAEAVVKVQDSTSGCWYQVMEQGPREGNYLEGSVTSMLAYSLLKSARLGYIDSSYLESGKKAFEGITKHLMKYEADGSIVISPVCAVAGLGGKPYRDGSYEYYINEALRDNDPKAVGPFIKASIELELLNK